MEELLPVGTRVHCNCPRVLVAGTLQGRLRLEADGHLTYGLKPAEFVLLKIWHREGCAREIPELEAAS